MSRSFRLATLATRATAAQLATHKPSVAVVQPGASGSARLIR